VVSIFESLKEVIIVELYVTNEILTSQIKIG